MRAVIRRAVVAAGGAFLLAAVPVSQAGASSGGTFTTIDVPGASSTEVFGVNDKGQIVGEYSNAHGFEFG